VSYWDNNEILKRLWRIEARLARIEQALGVIASDLEELMPGIDDVVKKVGEVKDVEDSVITLLDSVHQMLVEARNDPAKVQAVLDTLDQRKQALADAVTRNTDAA
jgi:predicted transcriptional regulator